MEELLIPQSASLFLIAFKIAIRAWFARVQDVFALYYLRTKVVNFT